MLTNKRLKGSSRMDHMTPKEPKRQVFINPIRPDIARPKANKATTSKATDEE
jgi:hypothetical protein